MLSTAIETEGRTKTGKKIKFMCPGKQNAAVKVILPCSKPGIMKINLKRLYVFDYLALFRLGKKCMADFDVVVLPTLPEKKIMAEMENEVKREPEDSFSDKKSGNDSSEIFGIRDYVAGDLQRSIHWKLSAKTGDLMVKEFSRPRTDNDYVIIDLFDIPEAAKKRDRMYSLLIGLARTMTARGFGFNGVYHKPAKKQGTRGDIEVMRVENDNDLVTLFSALYRMRPYGSEESCADYFSAVNGGKNNRIFYVTEIMNAYVPEKLFALSECGTVFYMMDGQPLTEFKGNKI